MCVVDLVTLLGFDHDGCLLCDFPEWWLAWFVKVVLLYLFWVYLVPYCVGCLCLFGLGGKVGL